MRVRIVSLSVRSADRLEVPPIKIVVVSEGYTDLKVKGVPDVGSTPTTSTNLVLRDPHAAGQSLHCRVPPAASRTKLMGVTGFDGAMSSRIGRHGRRPVKPQERLNANDEVYDVQLAA